MKLLIKPSIIGISTATLWFISRLKFGLFADKADEGLMASGTIAFLFFVYGLMAAFIMAKVWTEWRDMEDAVRNKDEQKFLDLKDQRIPRTLRILLITFSMFIIISFFIAGFQNIIKGAFSLFAVSFMLATVWEILMDLDDYFTGEWNIKMESLPGEWRTKYFKHLKAE